MMVETLKEITVILEWYKKLSKDYVDIDKLLYTRKQLSCCSVELGTIVGEFRADYDSTYFKRKVSFAKAFIEYKKTDKMTDTKATQLANIEIEDINDIEKHLEGQFNKGRMILHQVNAVLSSMQQQLSYLKEEKKSVTVRENT